MIRFEIIIPRAPATHNQVYRNQGRRLYVRERTAWKEYLQLYKNRVGHHGSPFWWEQKNDLDSEGRARPVCIQIVAVYPRKIDFDAALVKPLIDCLGSRSFTRGKRTKKLSQVPREQFEGVGILIDDAPEYVSCPLVVQSIHVRGHSATFLRVRDAEDYRDANDDMRLRMEHGGEIIGAAGWW